MKYHREELGLRAVFVRSAQPGDVPTCAVSTVKRVKPGHTCL